MRRLAAIALCALALPAAASAADRSWAQPQIETVVEAGLLADTVAAFKPQRPLTQRALGAALETLSLSNEEPVEYSYPVVVPGRAVTIRELDAALVGFLGLGDAARSITSALRDAGLRPKAGAGSETVARLLGLRLNHPAGQDTLELGLNDPATRAETAYSLARLLEFSGWEQDEIRAETEALFLPELSDAPARGAHPCRLVRRLPVRLGRDVRGGAAAVREAGTRRLRLLRVRLAGVQARAVRRCVRARERPARPHDVRDVGRGAAGAADQERRRTSSRAT